MLTLDSAYKLIAKDYKETLMFCLLAAIAVFIPIVGILLFMGLFIRIISNSINKKDEIPKVFGNFSEDVINGLKHSLFMLILSIPFVAIFAGSFGAMINSAMSQDSSSMINVMLNMGSLWVIAALLVIAYAFIVPALNANFAKEKKFGAFFEIGKAFNMVFGNLGAFFKMIGINILYGIVLSAISGALSFTVIVPFLVSPLQLIISGKIIGDWYSEVSKK